MTVADFFADVRQLMREYRLQQPGRDTVVGIAFWHGMENPNYDKDLLNRWHKGYGTRYDPAP